MKTKELELLEPIIIQGQPTKKLTVRMPTVGDEEDSMEMAIMFGRASNTMTLEMCLFSKITGVPYDVLRTMDAHNYGLIRDAANSIVNESKNEISQKKEINQLPLTSS